MHDKKCSWKSSTIFQSYTIFPPLSLTFTNQTRSSCRGKKSKEKFSVRIFCRVSFSSFEKRGKFCNKSEKFCIKIRFSFSLSELLGIFAVFREKNQLRRKSFPFDLKARTFFWFKKGKKSTKTFSGLSLEFFSLPRVVASKSTSYKHMCGLRSFRTRNSPSKRTSLRWGDSCFC